MPVSASPNPGHDEVLIPIETSRGERWIAISGVRFFGGTVYAFRDLTDARELDEIKADFIATASHELRTPIFSLGGFVELLEDEDLDPDTRRRFLEQVRDQVERLRKQQVERARYESELAQRRYMRVDPDNRLGNQPQNPCDHRRLRPSNSC